MHRVERSAADSELYIRYLIIPILFLLAAPNFIDAAEVKVSYEDYQKTIIYKPSCDPVKGVAQEGACFYQAPKPKAVATNTSWYERQCVQYAKALTGVYGTWGNGGRLLSANSNPMVGAVIVFRYTHVGVITQFDGYNIGFTDRNYDRKGGIRQIVWTTINDPTIWYYHKF